MKRIALPAVVLLLALMMVAPAAIAGPEGEETTPGAPEGILLAGCHDEGLSGKLYFNAGGEWAHIKDFFCPGERPRDISSDQRYLVTAYFNFDYPERIYLWDLAGDELRAVVENKLRDSSGEVCFSPKGDKILHLSGTAVMRGPMSIDAIRLIDMESGAVTAVTSPDQRSRVHDARWSADGRHVLYMETFFNDDDSLSNYLKAYDTVNGNTETILALGDGTGGLFEVSPNNDDIVISFKPHDGQHRLFLFKRSTGQMGVLYPRQGHTAPNIFPRNLAFSPGGDKLAYASTRTDADLWTVGVLDIQTGAHAVIADNMPGDCWYGVDPVWSPDGKGLLYTVPDSGNEWPALAVVRDITKPDEVELFCPDLDILFYAWVTSDTMDIAAPGHKGFSSAVVGYDIMKPYIEKYIPLGTSVVHKGGLEFEFRILPRISSGPDDYLDLEIIVRRDGRRVTWEDVQGNVTVWTGNRGKGQSPCLFRGADRLHGIIRPGTNEIVVEFEGVCYGKPLEFAKKMPVRR